MNYLRRADHQADMGLSAISGGAGAIRVELAILGLPVTFLCDGPELGATVRSACHAVAGWKSGGETGLTIHLTTESGDNSEVAPELRVEGQRLSLTGRNATGYAFASLRSAWCSVRAGYVANPPLLFAEVIEPIVLFLAARNGRTPLHAAAIQLDGFAVLLAGESGSGKSSLALAADRRGLRVLSEDMTFVQSEPELAIWGWGDRTHVFPADAAGEEGPVRVRNGKRKIAIAIAASNPGAANRDAVFCLLAKGDGLSLRRLSAREARERLHLPECGFDLLSADICRVEERFTRSGAWLLTLSADPAEAIELLVREAPALRAGGFVR